MISVCFNRFLMVTPIISSRTFVQAKIIPSNSVSQGLQVVPFIFIFCQGTKAPKGKGHCQRWREDKDRNNYNMEKWRKRHDLELEGNILMLCLSKMDHMIVHTWILQQLWCTQGNRAKLIADAQIPVLIFQGNSKLMPILDAFGEVVRFYWIMNGTHNTYPLYTDEYVSYILLSSLVHKNIYIYV